MGKYLIIVILTYLLFLMSCGNQANDIVMPEAKKGVIDLKGWDFDKNGPLKLKGEWEFFWKKLYTPSDFKSKNIVTEKYFDVPGYWNGSLIDGEKIGGDGFATFSLKIIHANNQKPDVFIDEQMTAYNFWCDNSLIHSCGKVSEDPNQSIPRVNPTIKTIDLSKDTTLLVLQISNFNHRVGGFFNPIEIGNKKTIYIKRLTGIAFDLFLFGSILIMGFYHFGVFFMRKENRVVLFFGLFTVVLSIRTLFTGSQFITYVFPNIDWVLKYRIEYLTLFFAPALIVTYLYEIYREEFKKKHTMIYVLICLLYSLTIFFPSRIFTRLLLPFQLIVIITIFYYFVKLLRIVFRNRNGSRILFLSLLVFFITIINDILYTNGTIMWSAELVPFGTFIFVLGQSLAITKIFTGAFYENEALMMELDYQNKHLELLVKQRTIELENKRKDIAEKNEELRLQNEEIQAINENLEEQKEHLEKSEAKIRNLVELLPEAIFELDWDGNIVYANDEFYKKLGYPQLNGQHKINVEQLIVRKKEEEEIAFMEKIDKLLSEDKLIKELEYLLIKKDQTVFPVLLSLSLVPENEKTAFRCVFIDISVRVENERKIKTAYKEIRKQNKDITDSIQYAHNIQKAVLPSSTFIASLFSEFFIINQPRSIVSGDFYYFEQKDNKIVLAVADCTGHGVPGGFMTMLGMTLLNDLYSTDTLPAPDLALEMMRKRVITSLDQKLEYTGRKDGMDIILCVFDKKTLIMEFASANQPLYIIRNGELIIYKGDKMPVGIYQRMEKFSNNKVQLFKNDIVYLFTDGVVDLFGGEKDRRLYSRGLQEVILKCCNEKLADQAAIIENYLKTWKGENAQTDDMLMIGLRI